MTTDGKVGIGIVTYNRPDYFKKCLEHVLKNIKTVDYIIVYNDGSSVDYKKVFLNFPWSEKLILIDKKENVGVAGAKNFLLTALLEAGCDHLFILEDDILLLDDKAVTEYIRIGADYGFDHLMFAHHGPANKDQEHYQDDNLAYWPNCIGAWCYYTRHCLEELKNIESKTKTADNKPYPFPGMFDENFHNAWEHVEHTIRLGNTGFTAWLGFFPDITKSKEYIAEIPEAIDTSTIRKDAKWRERIKAGLDYWQTKWGSAFPIDELVVNLDADQDAKQASV